MNIHSHTRPPAGQSSSLSFSGLARAGRHEHLTVHDTKGPDGLKLSSFNSNSLEVEQVHVDWSRTGTPADLEAVADLKGQPGEFLAVEGSKYSGAPKLFLLEYAEGEARGVKRFEVPDLPYEVEGMVTQAQPDGDVLVVLGGRGDGKTQEGRLHWGLYDPEEQSLEWSAEGLKGLPVRMPEHLGSNERPISDLHLTAQGDLWAAGCTDNGDEGPFESLVYRVGRLDGSAHNPITLTLDHPHHVPGEKIEALDANAGQDGGRFLFGTDNEAFGGALQSLLAS